MTKEEIGKLISDGAAEVCNRNLEIIKANLTQEVAEAENLSVLYFNLLRTAIELSTINTLRVLQELGVEIPEMKNPENP